MRAGRACGVWADFFPVWFCFSVFIIFSSFASFTSRKRASFLSRPSPWWCRKGMLFLSQLFNLDFFFWSPQGDIPPTTAALAPERAPYRPGAPLETSFPRGAFGPVPDTR